MRSDHSSSKLGCFNLVLLLLGAMIPFSNAGLTDDIANTQSVLKVASSYQEEGLLGGLDPNYHVTQAQQQKLHYANLIQTEIERVSRSGLDPSGESVGELQIEAQLLLKEFETTPREIDVEVAKLPNLKTIADEQKIELNNLIEKHKFEYWKTEAERLVDNEKVTTMSQVQEQLERNIVNQEYEIWRKEDNWRRRKDRIGRRINQLEELKRTHGSGGEQEVDGKIKQLEDLNLKLSTKIIIGTVATLIIAGIAIPAIGYFFLGWFHPTESHNDKAAMIRAHELSIEPLGREYCDGLNSEATRIQEVAQEKSPLEWNATMNAMGSVYALAYKEAHQFGIQNLTQLVAESWGPAATPPADLVIPRYASEEYKKNLTSLHIEEQKHWYMTELLRPLRLEAEFTEQHHQFIHQTAWESMKKSTQLPFDTNSQHFTDAYTVHFARTSFPGGCSGYIREDKATVKHFANMRIQQASDWADTQETLETYFVARSKASPPAPSLPAVLALPVNTV